MRYENIYGPCPPMTSHKQRSIGIGHGRGCDEEFMPCAPPEELEPVEVQRLEVPECLSVRQYLDIVEVRSE